MGRDRSRAPAECRTRERARGRRALPLPAVARAALRRGTRSRELGRTPRPAARRGRSASTATSSTRTTRPRRSTPRSSSAAAQRRDCQSARIAPTVTAAVKVVIFCGGHGMRLESGNNSERLPKPMAVDRRPPAALAHHEATTPTSGTDASCSASATAAARSATTSASRSSRDDGWEIEFLDTGLDSSIGERFAPTRDYDRRRDMFLASYGDTLTDAARCRHWSRTRAASGKLGEPAGCPAELHVQRRHAVDEPTSSPASTTLPIRRIWINGGFFVFDRRGLRLRPGRRRPAGDRSNG